MLHFNLEKPLRLLWVGEFISPEKGWKHLSRQLYEYELMIVTEGTLYIADEAKEYCVHGGEYLIMSPTRFQHGTRECRCRFFWMHFRADNHPSSLSLPAQGVFSDENQIRNLIGSIIESEKEQPHNLLSDYIATHLLILLAKGAKTPERMQGTGVVNAIKEFVHWHRFAEIRVSDIAKELGYHKKYLSALFHRETGQSLKSYLENERLSEAKRLLAETEYSVSEVAFYLNFSSPHNFSRFFRAQTGMTPTQFRGNL